MSEAEKIVQEVTDLLIENGCTINKPAMLELAIYVCEREKLALKKLEITPLNNKGDMNYV